MSESVMKKGVARTAAENGCHGRLMRIEKHGEILKENVPYHLPFAQCQDPQSTNKSIHAGTTETLDVLVVAHKSQHHQVVHIPTAGCVLETLWLDNQVLTFQETGCDYLLTLRVQGVGASGTRKLRFRWTGDHKTSLLVPYQPANPETLRQLADQFQAEAQAIAGWPDNRDNGFLQRYGESRHRMNALIRSIIDLDAEKWGAICLHWKEFTQNDSQLDVAFLWKVRNTVLMNALMNIANKLRQ